MNQSVPRPAAMYQPRPPVNQGPQDGQKQDKHVTYDLQADPGLKSQARQSATSEDSSDSRGGGRSDQSKTVRGQKRRDNGQSAKDVDHRRRSTERHGRDTESGGSGSRGLAERARRSVIRRRRERRGARESSGSERDDRDRRTPGRHWRSRERSILYSSESSSDSDSDDGFYGRSGRRNSPSASTKIIKILASWKLSVQGGPIERVRKSF